MTRNESARPSDTAVETQDKVGFGELCRMGKLKASVLVEFVQHGVLEPEGGGEPETWRFSAESVRRFQIARRLHRDLELNVAGVALALHLLEELDETRARLRVLERQVGNRDDQSDSHRGDAPSDHG